MFSWFGKVSFVPYSKVADFAVHLKNGRLMGSACKKCGFQTFPPRADCPECLAGEFEFKEYSGRGKLFTHTLISAAPTGFDDVAPYHLGVVELEEGGRLLKIGLEVQVVPRVFDEIEPIKVYYTIETPGTTWGKAPAV